MANEQNWVKYANHNSFEEYGKVLETRKTTVKIEMPSGATKTILNSQVKQFYDDKPDGYRSGGDLF